MHKLAQVDSIPLLSSFFFLNEQVFPHMDINNVFFLIHITSKLVS